MREKIFTGFMEFLLGSDQGIQSLQRSFPTVMWDVTNVDRRMCKCLIVARVRDMNAQPQHGSVVPVKRHSTGCFAVAANDDDAAAAANAMQQQPMMMQQQQPIMMQPQAQLLAHYPWRWPKQSQFRRWRHLIPCQRKARQIWQKWRRDSAVRDDDGAADECECMSIGSKSKSIPKKKNYYF